VNKSFPVLNYVSMWVFVCKICSEPHENRNGSANFFLGMSSLLYLLHKTESFLRSTSIFSYSRNFQHFFGTQKIIASLMSSRDLSLSRATLIQSIPSHPISWRSILTFFFHLCLRLPSDFFPSGFPTKTLYIPWLSPMPSPTHSSWFDHSNNLGWGVQIISLLIM